MNIIIMPLQSTGNAFERLPEGAPGELLLLCSFFNLFIYFCNLAYSIVRDESCFSNLYLQAHILVDGTILVSRCTYICCSTISTIYCASGVHHSWISDAAIRLILHVVNVYECIK